MIGVSLRFSYEANHAALPFDSLRIIDNVATPRTRRGYSNSINMPCTLTESGIEPDIKELFVLPNQM